MRLITADEEPREHDTARCPRIVGRIGNSRPGGHLDMPHFSHVSAAVLDAVFVRLRFDRYLKFMFHSRNRPTNIWRKFYKQDSFDIHVYTMNPGRC